MSATLAPASLAMILRALKLPTVAHHAEEVARQAERDGWTFERYLHHLVELEIHERRRGRIRRALVRPRANAVELRFEGGEAAGHGGDPM